MNTALLVGFFLGVVLTWLRFINLDMVPKSPRQAVIVLIACVLMGVPVSILSVAVYAFAIGPAITFVNRVDALERRCPADAGAR